MTAKAEVRHSYYEKHSEEIKERVYLWKADNPDKYRKYQHNYKIKTGAWLNQIEYVAKRIEQIERLNHDIDGIIEDAATQEILHNAERRTA